MFSFAKQLRSVDTNRRYLPLILVLFVNSIVFFLSETVIRILDTSDLDKQLKITLIVILHQFKVMMTFIHVVKKIRIWFKMADKM